nr:hypothetical protein [Tanacetum cinerariifolium]
MPQPVSGYAFTCLIDMVESPIKYTLIGLGAAGRKASSATRLSPKKAGSRRESIGSGRERERRLTDSPSGRAPAHQPQTYSAQRLPATFFCAIVADNVAGTRQALANTKKPASPEGKTDFDACEEKRSLCSYFFYDVATTLFDTSSFAREATQVEQTSTTHFTATNQLDFVDVRRQQRENPLSANLVRNLTNGESFSVGAWV